MQSKWIYNEKKKHYSWSTFDEEELSKLLETEKQQMLKFHNQEEIYSDYTPTNERLPIRISLVNETKVIFSFNHVFTNGLNIFRWIEKILSEYYDEPIEKEMLPSKPGIMLKLKSYISVLYAIKYLASFAKNKGEHFEKNTVDFSHGKTPSKSEKGYSIKRYDFTTEQTSAIIEKATKQNCTVAEYICTAFSDSFFNNAPDKNRICISAPTDLIGLVPGASVHSAGNYTGSLIFQVSKDNNTGQQIKTAFKQFGNLVPFGTAKIMSLMFPDHKKMGDHFLQQAKQPFNGRDPFTLFTFAFSNIGVINFPLMKKHLASCSGHTKNQTIFICPMTINNKLSIEVCVSNDLYDVSEVFGVTGGAVETLG